MIQPTQLALALHQAEICFIGHGHEPQYGFMFHHIPLHFLKPLPISIRGKSGNEIARVEADAKVTTHFVSSPDGGVRIAQTVEGEDVYTNGVQSFDESTPLQ